MSFPSGSIAVPDVVVRIAEGRPVAPAWVNELGGVTFSIAGDAFVKVYPAEHAALLIAEADRLRWAAGFTAVPRVLSTGPGWLHTAALPGRSAVDPHWAGRPAEAARAIGSGLRRLHDALPVDGCPFDRPSWVPADAPAADRLVVCHGDACAPNSLIGDDGRCSGHVDLGDLGVADRWADLAIATMSLAWNYPSADETALLEAYGVAPDRERIAYYRDRWDQWSEPHR
ncbi:aminoglycoside 3'-phosphotransferase [Mycobacterium hodleri]|uniref:aminoglycoside 3'-phosphotransferase n=1 Tax=Mycolicibacterium hodleri TaxID=49897 RepID=UPI0021F34453|nr:aminoglycoside 3'-phosphotransferase [Mycolicibacterium hodleri]MCV7131819.1 aminoglycoside 3'-phosphotransferase [Mycolicibacterium hodleri]